MDRIYFRQRFSVARRALVEENINKKKTKKIDYRFDISTLGAVESGVF